MPLPPYAWRSRTTVTHRGPEGTVIPLLKACAVCSKNVIIHRDLKPANLMIAGVPFEGGSREVAQKSGFVKIADFGLSRSLAITNPHSKTSADKEIENDR